MFIFKVNSITLKKAMYQVIEKSEPEGENGVYWYSYALNNPLKYIDPSGYSYQRFIEIFAEEQRDNQPSEFFNNYVGWWQDIQRSYSNSAWQYYVSSDFRNQFPNATFNIGTEGNLVLNGTPSGHWSPTQGRTSAIFGGITTTLEGKFTYHCPGEIEMSSYYIPAINLNSGFLDPSLNTSELDQSFSLGGIIFSAGKGISQSQIKSNIKALQKSGKGSLPYFSKGGRLLGFVSSGIDTKDFAINPTWGNAVIIVFDLGSMAPYGWIY